LPHWASCSLAHAWAGKLTLPMRGAYERVYERSLRDPETFWAEAAEDIRWVGRWDRVRGETEAGTVPVPHGWFEGGSLNTCDNALDLHVEQGRGEQPALVYDSPGFHRLLSHALSRLLRDRRCGLSR
jgi:hypothetical protein